MTIEKTERYHLFNLIYVDEISSTNTYLKEQFKMYDNYTVLIAKKQTNGRGRYNRVWLSGDDICFSILFKESATHALLAPLAIVQALKKMHCNVSIKWPNDIYLNQRKLSGILIEDVYEGQRMASIVGIGINRTNKPTVQAIGLNEFVSAPTEEIIKAILAKYEALLSQPQEDVIQSYKHYSLVLGKRVLYQEKEYLVQDIAANGNLVLVDSNQNVKVICSDEINIKEAMLKN